MIDPTSPLGDTLRELVQEWRRSADALTSDREVMRDDRVKARERIARADELAALVRAVPLGAAQEVKTCNWMLESDGEYYDTQCGFAFHVFDDGTPLSNGLNFCAYCGGRLYVGPYIPPVACGAASQEPRCTVELIGDGGRVLAASWTQRRTHARSRILALRGVRRGQADHHDDPQRRVP